MILVAGMWKNSETLDEILGSISEHGRKDVKWPGFVHPDDQVDVVAYFNNHVLRDGYPFDKDHRIVRMDDNAVRWVHCAGRIEVDHAGQPGKNDRPRSRTSRTANRRKTRLIVEKNKLQSVDRLSPTRPYLSRPEYNIIFQNRFMGDLFGHYGRENVTTSMNPAIRSATGVR